MSRLPDGVSLLPAGICRKLKEVFIGLHLERSWGLWDVRLLAGQEVIFCSPAHQRAPVSADHSYRRILSCHRLGGKATLSMTGIRMTTQNSSVSPNASLRYCSFVSLTCESIRASAAPCTPRLVIPIASSRFAAELFDADLAIRPTSSCTSRSPAKTQTSRVSSPTLHLEDMVSVSGIDSGPRAEECLGRTTRRATDASPPMMIRWLSAKSCPELIGWQYSYHAFGLSASYLPDTSISASRSEYLA